MRSLVIVGAGSLGRETLSYLRGSVGGPGQPSFGGFLDSAASAARVSLTAKGVTSRVFFADEAVAALGPAGFLLAIADPEAKERAYEELVDRGLEPCGLLHEQTLLGDRVRIGEACVICPGALLTADVEVGRGVLLNPGTRLGHDVTIGEFSSLLGSNTIGGEVRVGSRVTIGQGAIVHPRIEVGDDAMVGMGSAVFRDVPRGASVLGNPARRIDMH